MYARSRPSKVRNPRTVAQQANRHKLSVASRFLAQVQAFAVKGFKPGKRPNGRPVGAYHMALGHLLNYGMTREDGQWRIDYEHVELSTGARLTKFPMTVKRVGHSLALSWRAGLPKETQRIRLALHSAKRGRSQYILLAAPRAGESVTIPLPKWAGREALHLWWMPVVKGKARWRSAYVLVPKAGRSRRVRSTPSRMSSNLTSSSLRARPTRTSLDKGWEHAPPDS